MNSATRTFKITFGALAEPLKRQLAEQGLKMFPQPLRRLQAVMNSRTDLMVGSWLSDSEADKVAKRILKAIRREVERRMASDRGDKHG